MAEKKEIILLLEQIADLLEFRNENPFKISAFRNGANTVRKLDGDINELVQSQKIKEVKGIGKGIFAVIEEYTSQGFSSQLSELKEGLPDSLFELFGIRGLGPKKIAILFRDANITSLKDLKTACLENKLITMKGFGQKLQDKILEEIKLHETTQHLKLFNVAESIACEIEKIVSNIPGIEKYSFTGEYRRKLEVFSSIELVLLVSNGNGEIVTSSLQRHLNIENSTDKLLTSIADYSLPVHFYLTSTLVEFTAALFQTTGSHEFLEMLKFKSSSKRFETEEEIFASLNSEYVSPEMREPEYFNFKTKTLKRPSNLSQNAMHGLFHFHTTFSDGIDSLEDMILTAAKIGYDYFVVCDHSKTAAYANGLNEQRLLQQKNEIERLNDKYDLRILHGIESDILTDGKLDYSADILANFHFIAASIHSNFSLSEDAMTKRIITAIENPFTDVIGHLTGRLLLHRSAYKLDVKKIIDACAANNVAIEINAHPNRLDLDWRNIFYAREKGCLFAINPDAHSTSQISLTRFGIEIAKKGGIQIEEVINCYNYEQFVNFLNRKVKRKLK